MIKDLTMKDIKDFVEELKTKQVHQGLVARRFKLVVDNNTAYVIDANEILSSALELNPTVEEFSPDSELWEDKDKDTKDTARFALFSDDKLVGILDTQDEVFAIALRSKPNFVEIAIA
jgi:CBS domain-containing protein